MLVIPVTTSRLPAIWLSALAVFASVRAGSYVRHWSFRRQVLEPTAVVLDNLVRKGSPSGQGLMSVDIPRDFRDREGADIVVRLPMDWAADKADMDKLVATVRQRLSADDLSATWTLSGRKPHVRLSAPARPPMSADFADMTTATAMTDADSILMGPGSRGQMIDFSLALESPHLLLAGGSGAGKSELIAWIVGQFMRRGAGVLVLDAKFVSHMWLRRVPGVLYAAETEELHEALLWLDRELLRRSRFVAAGGDPDELTLLVAVLEEMNAATNRLRAYWKNELGGKGMSPALTALGNLSSMGREMRLHILMAGQSMTSKATAGTENRENFGGRALARATAAQWRMLAPQIRPAPLKNNKPGRWHLVVQDSLREFQAPFCDIKHEVARLIEWATGGLPIPDVPAMMLGGGATERVSMPRSEAVPPGVSLSDYASVAEVDLAWLRRQIERRPEAPAPVAEGPNRTRLYDRGDLDVFVAARIA